VVVEEEPSWGVFSKLQKTCWWPKFANRREVDFPEGICQSRGQGVRFWGPPSSFRGICLDFVNDKALQVGGVLQQLAIVEDLQVEFLLHRACIGICKLLHVLSSSIPTSGIPDPPFQRKTK
jgi:hypothetical protein